jgi:hypothetical protein
VGVDKRALAMLALYKQGSTLHEIGTRYNITRERVRQIMSNAFGICRVDGGSYVRSSRRVDANRRAKDAHYIGRWGCTVAERRAMPANIRKAWAEQKRNSANRGIPFLLTLKEFWEIWRESGKWEQRGRGADKYCMSRLKDCGAYAVGNVQILTNAENCRLSQLQNPSAHKIRGKDEQGVITLMPGTRKPYKAFHARRHLGFFATKEEAYEARRRYLLTLEAA